MAPPGLPYVDSAGWRSPAISGWQEPLLHARNHGVGGIEDIPDVVANALPEQHRRHAEVEAVVCVKPAHQLGGGVLNALVERAGIAAISIAADDPCARVFGQPANQRFRGWVLEQV